MDEQAPAQSIFRRAGGAANMLRRAGARRGRPVVAVAASSEALAIAAHAAFHLGSPFFPLDPALPSSIRDDLIAQIGECLIVGDDGAVSTEALLSAPLGEALALTPPQGPALLIATSGSSGRPKIATLTGANLAAAAAASATITPLRAGDRWLACLPLFHIGGFSILSRCALAGAEAVLHQGFDPERVFRVLARERISHVSLTPTMLAQLLSLRHPAPKTLRHALVGGASLSADLAREAAQEGWPVQPTYGMSETASQLATLPRLPRDWRSGQVGRPLGGAEVAPDGERGLKIRSPMVMQGYANPELAPGDGLVDGWFVASDLAEITPEGELVILGRRDDVIVTGGKKVHPASVENLLSLCPGVDAVAVAGRPDRLWGEIVIAIFAGSATREDVLDWCRRHIAGARRPRAAIRVDRIPQLGSGKPDRSALRKLAAGSDSEAGTVRQNQLSRLD
ncbi:class I adenylate-forming enzyme family protein [Rhodoblastus sp.]|uniref:class I adenylate-forming enzyme family protein n=1 Tax=Rhodoblastus sp. TaxID=1962975 RepID=UPI003F998629